MLKSNLYIATIWFQNVAEGYRLEINTCRDGKNRSILVYNKKGLTHFSSHVFYTLKSIFTILRSYQFRWPTKENTDIRRRKAILLNFHYTLSPSANKKPPAISHVDRTPCIKCKIKQVWKIFLTLDTKKAIGLYEIPLILLNKYASWPDPDFAKLFQLF